MRYLWEETYSGKKMYGKKFYIIGYFELHMVSEETSRYIEKELMFLIGN